MLQSHHALPPFVEVAWEMLHHNPSILYFKALSLVIQVGTLSELQTHQLLAGCKYLETTRCPPQQRSSQLPHPLSPARLTQCNNVQSATALHAARRL